MISWFYFYQGHVDFILMEHCILILFNIYGIQNDHLCCEIFIASAVSACYKLHTAVATFVVLVIFNCFVCLLLSTVFLVKCFHA